QIARPSAVSHFPAPYIFLPGSITDIALGNTTLLLTRIVFPRRLSDARKLAGRNMRGAGR
ncbi:hypothetical protein, partial [Novipirellula sp.]|uniref:hypothetical protein n=1 Tax=Novipirellula sp. TaxID=2795430 RepID=UPI0035641EBF